MKIVEIINSDGDVVFLKIRYMLEDVQREIDKSNPHAIQFAASLDRVLRFCEAASKIPFSSDT